MRKLLIILALVLALPPGEAVSVRSADPTLKTYLARMGVQMNAYRAVLTRADTTFALTREKAAIAGLKARSRETTRIVTRLKRVRPPRPLAASHRKIVRALTLLATAFRGYAAARERYLKNRNRGSLVVANTVQHNRLRTAQALQLTWARAVRARTVKAGLVVPKWLRDFF